MVRSLITKSDYSVMRRANNWEAPRWVRVYVTSATRVGDGWLWYAMGLAIVMLGGKTRFEAVGAAGVSSVLSILLFVWLKRLTGRRRPCQIEPHCWATLLPPDRFSFPSGHTMTAFAVAIPLSLFYPTLAIGLAFCALSIAVSRILLGMHFLSDVVAGALIGTGLGYLGYFAFQLS
ncbi:MAG TPA: phosphatase PAP2 family protein [Bryobacteraceae bacterium]|jgi:undecaprenyl-diphosphatase|nr:phosphatase PAP2 family protein [Bryobacteraceae bacterium]